MATYRSPYEAYSFLSDDDDDLRCDFEIATDKYASQMGLLASLCPEFKDEILQLELWVYHANPTLRTKFTLTKEEMEQLVCICKNMQEKAGQRLSLFLLPAGSSRACLAHVLRSEGKDLVRMIYRYQERSAKEYRSLIDFFSLLSGYFFSLAMVLNRLDAVAEIPFESRNYTVAKD